MIVLYSTCRARSEAHTACGCAEYVYYDGLRVANWLREQNCDGKLSEDQR